MLIYEAGGWDVRRGAGGGRELLKSRGGNVLPGIGSNLPLSSLNHPQILYIFQTTEFPADPTPASRVVTVKRGHFILTPSALHTTNL